jgi:hypothetical protein
MNTHLCSLTIEKMSKLKSFYRDGLQLDYLPTIDISLRAKKQSTGGVNAERLTHKSSTVSTEMDCRETTH